MATIKIVAMYDIEITISNLLISKFVKKIKAGIEIKNGKTFITPQKNVFFFAFRIDDISSL